jgi:hypothetical protein
MRINYTFVSISYTALEKIFSSSPNYTNLFIEKQKAYWAGQAWQKKKAHTQRSYKGIERNS